MMGPFAGWISSRRWFVRWVMFAEHLLLASFAIGMLLLKSEIRTPGVPYSGMRAFPMSWPSHHRSSLPLRFLPTLPASIRTFQHLLHIAARPLSQASSLLGSPSRRVAGWRPLASLGQNSQRITP